MASDRNYNDYYKERIIIFNLSDHIPKKNKILISLSGVNSTLMTSGSTILII